MTDVPQVTHFADDATLAHIADLEKRLADEKERSEHFLHLFQTWEALAKEHGDAAQGFYNERNASREYAVLLASLLRRARSCCDGTWGMDLVREIDAALAKAPTNPNPAGQTGQPQGDSEGQPPQPVGVGSNTLEVFLCTCKPGVCQGRKLPGQRCALADTPSIGVLPSGNAEPRSAQPAPTLLPSGKDDAPRWCPKCKEEAFPFCAERDCPPSEPWPETPSQSVSEEPR